MTRVRKPNPTQDQNGQKRYPIFYDYNIWKLISSGAVHTHIAHEESTPLPWSSKQSFGRYTQWVGGMLRGHEAASNGSNIVDSWS